MPLDLSTLAGSGHTALVTSEIQNGVIGAGSALPELAKNAQAILPNIARLVQAARRCGIPVIHCTVERRSDGRGANQNCRLFHYMARAETKLLAGSEAVKLVPEVPLEDSDIVLSRLHGISPFQGTELDFVLRNLGVSTIVGTGVSVNVAIANLAFDAVNSSYQMVIPRDAVAGFPSAYVEQVFEHSLAAIATLVTTAELLEAWSQASGPG